MAVGIFDRSHCDFCLRRHKMSKIIRKILDTIQSIREANYAATLARNGKTKEAQNCYADSIGICRGL